MDTIGASRLSKSLDKAKNIGAVEESFTINGCDITLENLSPDDYAAVFHECQGLEDIDYLHTYQKQHLARSIVEINGVDLRGVRYVEDEGPDPKNPEQTRIFKVEKYAYLLNHVLSTWKKEAVFTAYRKFTDVVEKAERQAKDGVTFLTPDETPEEKYRRLLLEAKECEEDMPSSLIAHVLDDMGFMQKSSADELKAAMEKTDRMAREAEEQEPEEEEYEEPVPEPVQRTVEVQTVQAPEEPPSEPQAAPERPVAPTPKRPVTDPHKTLQDAIAARKREIPTPVQEEEPTTEKKASRAEKIAALEADAATSGLALEVTGSQGEKITAYRLPGQEPVEVRKQDQVNPTKVAIDKPPVAGINPRFNPPKRNV